MTKSLIFWILSTSQRKMTKSMIRSLGIVWCLAGLKVCKMIMKLLFATLAILPILHKSTHSFLHIPAIFLTDTKFKMAIKAQHHKVKSGELDPAKELGLFTKHFPDLCKLFRVHKPRFFKRTSSAHWDSPPLKREYKV